MDVPATPLPPGRFKSMFRSILRDANTPSTGQSVRWDARNAFRTITPNTSAGSATEGAPSMEDIPRTPLLEDEEHTSFLDRLQSDSSEGKSGTNRIDELAALGQSVGSKLTSTLPAASTTPPPPGPAPAPKSTAPIPRPRFTSNAPSTSSPLARDDSTLSLPNSMSPAPDFSLSHKPFDMSCEMDAIPIALGNESSGSRGNQPSVITLGDIDEDGTKFYSGEDVSPVKRSTLDGTAGPGKSVRGMTTRYPPGMFNLTKSQARLSELPVDPDTSGERSQPSLRPKRRDTTGSSSLDFITASGGSARTSLPSTPMPDFDPPSVSARPRSLRSSLPARAKSTSTPLSRSDSYSNLLSRATTTAPPRELLANTLPRELTARELPTLYPPGHMRFDQTTVVPHVDPDNIPELTRFFTPTLGEGDVSMTRTTIGYRPSDQSQTFAPDTDRESFLPDATGVPLPVSPPLTISTSSSRSDSASSSIPSPTSLTDLTNLIESQYKADLAAHAALVPILLARAESAEGSAKRLAGVVKDTRGRIRELEMLCVELGGEVGILREERAGLASERIELVSQVNDLSAERDTLLGEVGNSSAGVAGAEKSRDASDVASEQALREMHAMLRRAEVEASRSRRRKEERDLARAAVRQLEARVAEMEIRERDWEVRVEKERDGQGERERGRVEKEREGWERERVELLDRCVRAEKALGEAQSGGGGEGDEKLRRQLEEYKREVEAQWKYAEQSDERIKALEAENKSLHTQLDAARRSPRVSSPRADVTQEWKAKEAEWDRERHDWARQQDVWTRTQAAWAAERARVESRKEEIKAEVAGLRAEVATLQAERDALGAQAGDAQAELERMDGEMAALADRARHAEEMYVAEQQEVERLNGRIRDLENRASDGGRVRRLELEKAELLEDIKTAEGRLGEMEQRAEELEERCVKAEEERNDVLRDRAEVEEELEKLRVEVEDEVHARGEIEQERNVLAEELVAEQEAHAAVATEHDQLVQRLEQVERERHIALENQQRLEGVVRTRNQEIAEVEERLLVQSRETEQLRTDKRELEKVKVQRDDAVQAERHLRTQLEAKTVDSAELDSLRERVAKLSEESTRLQRRVNELKAESAGKEVRIVQLNKARALEAEDREGLNVALEAKQQELELIKRKLGVRGTAGATPAPTRVQRANLLRRESIASSAAFETPMPRAAMRKDADELPPSSESTASVLSSSVSTNPLQTSTRANIYDALSSTPATVKPARRTSEYVPRPSLRTSLSRLSVSGIRGVHFAPSESDATTETDPDATVHL
ncbi:hypothetical protein FRC08_010628 [Ceratobasidium sp. 394]|nr:hypothetical protein FRC08_010628 [Ceratobasidium sp. 394]